MDDNTFRDFVDTLKARADLVREISETQGDFGMSSPRGRYAHGVKHDSLVVDVERGAYWWNSAGEAGDVFTWLEKHRGMEFNEAVRYLASKYQVPLPEEWGKRESTPAAAGARARMDLFEVAADWFAARIDLYLAARHYASGRGWNAETIQKGRVGFTGTGKPEERKDLIGDLQLHGHDPESPAAVAIVGFSGDVKGWAKKYSVEPQENWVQKGRIYGLLDFPRLIYPHVEARRVTYFSARNLEWSGANLVGVTGKHKTYNLPKALVGDRRVFYNQEYMRSAKSVVLVEGPADAITLGQWGLASVALMGVSTADLGGLFALLKERHERIYLGLDGDEAGLQALIGRNRDWPLGRELGPMTWLVSWPKGKGKDANDWLQTMIQDGMDADQQHKEVNRQLGLAQPLVTAAADWAGGMKGADKLDAEKVVFAMVATMAQDHRSMYRKRLADALSYGVREFDNIVKDHSKTQKDGDDYPMQETLGGVIQDPDSDGEWLLEFFYDPETDTTALAYRDPEGRVKTADMKEGIVIGGTRYIPKYPNSMMRDRAVLFPSRLGELKSTAELVAIVETFLKKYYLYDNKWTPRILAYYVLLTWLYDCFRALPYIRATGEAGAGKSEMLTRLGAVCYRLIVASGANTASTFFRTVDIYKGTVFIDEADLQDGGDMANDIVKFINQGAMWGRPITRMVEVVDREGRRIWEPGTFQTYCPKLIAMRREFKDDAVASRSLTFKLQPRESFELRDAGVPHFLDETFWKESENIRNLLVRWRLDVWEHQWDVDEWKLMDINISARLNQVTMPIKALASQDERLLKEIETFLQVYNQEMVLSRSMTFAARIIEALWKIYRYTDLRGTLVQKTTTGDEIIYVGDVAKIANELLAAEEGLQEDEEDEDTQRKKRRPTMTSHLAGKIIRNELQLEVGARRKNGFPVVWMEERMKALAKRYGVDWEAIPNGSSESAKQATLEV